MRHPPVGAKGVSWTRERSSRLPVSAQRWSAWSPPSPSSRRAGVRADPPRWLPMSPRSSKGLVRARPPDRPNREGTRDESTIVAGVGSPVTDSTRWIFDQPLPGRPVEPSRIAPTSRSSVHISPARVDQCAEPRPAARLPTPPSVRSRYLHSAVRR